MTAPDALGRDPRVAPRCGDCGACALCDAVLAYEDRVAMAPRDAHEAPPAHEPADDPRRHHGGPVVDVAGTCLLFERGAEVWHCDWRRLAERARELGGVDALITDAPYSDRTHSGAYETSGREAADGGERRAINYASWSVAEVSEFVEAWAPITRGWLVSITDDVLAPWWRAAYKRAGLCDFPMLPCIERGSGVRLVGDGPSSVTTFAAVARHRSREMMAWGTLPGFYDGTRERKPIVGGKPLWLMRALVRDYTRPGDLVCDPCGGAMTTGLACILEGRRFLGGDAMREHAQMGADRLRLMPVETKRGQLALAAGGE